MGNQTIIFLLYFYSFVSSTSFSVLIFIVWLILKYHLVFHLIFLMTLLIFCILSAFAINNLKY